MTPPSDPGAPARPPLPRFVVIGAQKSATRWLRSNLGRHPDVFAADEELAYFNRRYGRHDLDWYRDQFVGWSGEPIVGEATPGYMMWKHDPNRTARRIHESLPDVRLVALLRNPVDRANSAMVHHKKRGRIPPDARLLDLVRAQRPEDDEFGLVTGGWYAASLQQYRRLFGDRLLVVLHDDVQVDPKSVYQHVLEHIGAPPDFVPTGLEDIVFSNRESTSARRSQELSPRERTELYEYFRRDIRKLERLFDLDCSRWAPPTVADTRGDGDTGR